ncbi:MAG TPA: glycoside hydrolase family 3 protein [Thermomicrobiales bacterium]|nr:glycoside hydrolase family 3 protein [Thermomicrobiales bacterium]
MSRINLNALVGQSMMMRFEGQVFTDEARAAFREIRPGGIIYFADNITSREQIHALTRELQAEARSLDMPPLLISADQEAGIVSRLPADMVTPPGAMALTANGNPSETERCASITGIQLRQVGINTNFAPVVDVNNNPRNPVIRTRSYGDTVEKVATGALATFRGLESERVISCVKHFPGHGDTSVDSHLGLPVIDHPMSRLREIELAPFAAAIAAGVPAVMTTHILFPALDEHPATLSRAILTGLLREEMGFNGVIFTDSLSMDAIDQRYGLADAAIRCKAAGVDILESNEALDKQLVRFRALVAAVEDGTLPESAFAATLARLDALRGQYGLTGPVPDLPPVDPALRAEAERIAAGTIAVLGGGQFVPIAPNERALVVDFQRLRSSEAEDPFNRGGIVRDEVRRLLPSARVATLSHQPRDEEARFAIEAARSVSTLVVMTRDAIDFPYQVEIGRQAIDATPDGSRIVHVALRGPYDAGVLGDVSDTLLTFGDPAVTLKALIGIFAGTTRPTARLPVALA